MYYISILQNVKYFFQDFPHFFPEVSSDSGNSDFIHIRLSMMTFLQTVNTGFIWSQMNWDISLQEKT
jgi:hypothetical protein